MYYFLIVFTVFFQGSNWNVNEYGVAIYGYDPVSFFQENPQLGKAELAYQYDEAIFYFSNVENLEAFKTDPEGYLPQYGAYCAYAMGTSGKKVSINPETYKISDGRLFLFYNKSGNNTLMPWNEDELNLMKNADKNWNELTGSEN